MTPRLDLIQNGFIRPENEAFELDIVEYKNVLESRDLINGDVDQEYLYPFRSLIFHPCSKVGFQLSKPIVLLFMQNFNVFSYTGLLLV
jgi:hypothetical protein